jgi:redox-sensitive bicupin YhaK (pirin superfamily)
MAEHPRPVVERFPGVETLEGAGVRLRRAFGNDQVPLFDPFLLLDRFGSADPEDYLAGFPWHPHRGIETVTYMLNGTVEHGDSLGNSGAIESGDVQWMTAGSGIIHQEMPKRTEGMMQGFQLWVNLPAKEKMTTPAYRGLRAPDLPLVDGPDGAKVRVVAGSYGGSVGPVAGLEVDPLYLDVRLPPKAKFHQPIPKGHNSFAHTVEGELSYGPHGHSKTGETVHFGTEGDQVEATAGEAGARFLLVAGKPLGEPVAWYGPIVMNSREQLTEAVRELRAGTFVRERAPVVEE